MERRRNCLLNWFNLIYEWLIFDAITTPIVIAALLAFVFVPSVLVLVLLGSQCDSAYAVALAAGSLS